MFSTRTSSSRRPAKRKQSPGRRRAMKPSSTLPSEAPLPPLAQNFTAMLASLTMVPTLIRWRRARAALGTRQTPSSSGSTRR